MPIPIVRGFYDARTFSIQYVVSCPTTKRCAIIDPVLDFDEKSGATASLSADAILAYAARNGLTIDWVLDTHPHADHLSAADYLKKRTSARTGIGARIVDVQAIWKKIYGLDGLVCDGSQWDRLFEDGDTFAIGDLHARIMFTPGHTMASITYVIGDAAFINDTLFMPDTGSARTDFPGGSAARLHASVERILALPDDTRLFTGHDYGEGGRMPRWESTAIEQRTQNIHFADRPSEEAFVAIREARDRTLPMPRLILHALQVNVNAGRLPDPDADGRRHLRFPLDALPGAIWA